MEWLSQPLRTAVQVRQIQDRCDPKNVQGHVFELYRCVELVRFVRIDGKIRADDGFDSDSGEASVVPSFRFINEYTIMEQFVHMTRAESRVVLIPGAPISLSRIWAKAQLALRSRFR